jgi:hypothetical protein
MNMPANEPSAISVRSPLRMVWDTARTKAHAADPPKAPAVP